MIKFLVDFKQLIVGCFTLKPILKLTDNQLI